MAMTVGYSHEPAGPVMAAAKAGDIPALLEALETGGSTEEQRGESGPFTRVTAYKAGRNLRCSLLVDCREPRVPFIVLGKQREQYCQCRY